MFRTFFRPSSGAQWLQWQPLVLPWYEGKTRGYHCSHCASDDGRENARNILSCKQTLGQENEKLLHQVGDLFELNVKLRCQKVKAHLFSPALEPTHPHLQWVPVTFTSAKRPRRGVDHPPLLMPKLRINVLYFLTFIILDELLSLWIKQI
jgi:hypothetical protein